MKINGYRNRQSGQTILIDPIEGDYISASGATQEWEPVWVTIDIAPASPSEAATE